MTELLNGFKLLRGILSAGRKDVPHLERIVSDSLRHTVDGAELSWQVALLSVDLDHEQGLVWVSHLHLVGLEEILSDAHLATL